MPDKKIIDKIFFIYEKLLKVFHWETSKKVFKHQHAEIQIQNKKLQLITMIFFLFFQQINFLKKKLFSDFMYTINKWIVEKNMSKKNVTKDIQITVLSPRTS